MPGVVFQDEEWGASAVWHRLPRQGRFQCSLPQSDASFLMRWHIHPGSGVLPSACQNCRPTGTFGSSQSLERGLSFAQRSKDSRGRRDRLVETGFPPHFFQSWCLLRRFPHSSEGTVKTLIGVVCGVSHQRS